MKAVRRPTYKSTAPQSVTLRNQVPGGEARGRRDSGLELTSEGPVFEAEDIRDGEATTWSAISATDSELLAGDERRSLRTTSRPTERAVAIVLGIIGVVVKRLFCRLAIGGGSGRRLRPPRPAPGPAPQAPAPVTRSPGADHPASPAQEPAEAGLSEKDPIIVRRVSTTLVINTSGACPMGRVTGGWRKRSGLCGAGRSL